MFSLARQVLYVNNIRLQCTRVLSAARNCVKSECHVIEHNFSTFDPRMHIGARHCLITLARRKSTKQKKTEQKSDENSDDDLEVHDDTEESFNDLEEEDHTLPHGYKHVLVHSVRADNLVSKALKLSNQELETLFYKGRLLHNGKTLLKKAKKIPEGECIDVIQDNSDKSPKASTVLVKRVKIVKYLDRTTKKGRPITVVRVWRQPFEVMT